MPDVLVNNYLKVALIDIGHYAAKIAIGESEGAIAYAILATASMFGILTLAGRGSFMSLVAWARKFAYGVALAVLATGVGLYIALNRGGNGLVSALLGSFSALCWFLLILSIATRLSDWLKKH